MSALVIELKARTANDVAAAPRGPPRQALKGYVEPTRKIAAILSADVVGYSRLMGQDDRATVQDIVATRALATQHVRAYDGRMVDTVGDSMLADFSSAVQALHCAVSLQQALGQRNALRAESRRMALRIGLNIGDILEQDAALYGDGVNVAARLQALGEPGGVCVSAALHDLVQGRLPVAFEYAGEHRVKNIAKPIGVYHARFAGSPVALAGVTVEPPAAADPAGHHNLPQALSSFIGRQHEIGAVKALLSEHRLLTLVGPGGIGKTRLALQVAGSVAADFADGVWLVELAALSDARHVPQALASTLGVKEVAGKPVVQTLLEALKHKRLLIVLDNCEHVALACAEFAASLLAASTQVKLLATSREPLHVTGEVNFPVPMLSLPTAIEAATAQRLNEYEAIRLFVERAAAKSPGFALSDANAGHVLHICQCLDGMALAIELAAARVRVLSVEQIAKRLKDRFSLLNHGDRSVLPRQQALRALIDWSHDLLDERERCVFRRLAVFAGGWTLEAAEEVASGGDIARTEVVEQLTRLVEKSLVTMVEGGGRYRLLETMRQYAAEQLEAAGEGDTTRDRHLAFHVALAETARPHLSGSHQGEWLARLDLERENFLAARTWCNRADNGGEGALRILIALKLYLYSRGLLEMLRLSPLEALDLPGAQARTMLRSRALHTVGQVCQIMGRRPEALAYLEEALAIARELGDSGREAIVLQELGVAALDFGDTDAARQYLTSGLELANGCGDKRAQAAAANAMAQLHRSCGELDKAAPLYEQALELANELQDQQSIAVAQLNLAMVALGQGRVASARALLLQARDIAHSLGSRPTGQCVLLVASGLAAVSEEWRQLARFAGAADAEAVNTRIYMDAVDKTILGPLWMRAQRLLGDEAYASARSDGAALGYEGAMAEVLAWLGPEKGMAREA